MSDARRLEIRKLAKDQFRVVAYLAKEIADLHEAFGGVPEDIESFWDVMGSEYKGRSLYDMMNTLGDILNNLDAVDEDAPAFIDATFEKSHIIYRESSSNV